MSAAAVFLFAACEKVEAPDPGKPDDGGEGNDPVEETGFIPGTILAQYNETSVTLRQGTDESETLSYYFETDDEVTEERTVTLKVDETLVGDSRLLPEANYEFTETFTVPAGSYESAMQAITFKADGLEEGEYVLPIAEVVPEGETASEPLVYNITVRVPAQNKYKLNDEYKAVLYIDTDLYDPRIVTDYITNNQFGSDPEPFIVGWIANLRRASLKYENGRVMLSLGICTSGSGSGHQGMHLHRGRRHGSRLLQPYRGADGRFRISGSRSRSHIRPGRCKPLGPECRI